MLAGLEQATQLAFMLGILSPTLPRSGKFLLQIALETVQYVVIQQGLTVWLL